MTVMSLEDASAPSEKRSQQAVLLRTLRAPADVDMG